MRCYLGLGANIGRPIDRLAAAVSAIAASDAIGLRRLSSVYLTRPVGYANQPDFLNMVIAIEAETTPERLLEITAAIEHRLGRVRGTRNGPRAIDIDILMCGNIRLATRQLELPHPRMTARQFVLVPLAEIAPELLLPDGEAVTCLARPDDEGIRCCGRLAHLVRESSISSQTVHTEGD